MSHLISLDKVFLAFGLDPLLDKVKFQISAGERVCLIGRNGTGKSSLLKIIEGSLKPDSGLVYRQPQLRLGRLSQDLPQEQNLSVFEFVAQGLETLGKLLADYHKLTHELEQQSSPEKLAQLARLQQEMDANHAWTFEQRMETILTRLKLPPDQPVSSLSGGWQRRAALARALVFTPQLLLLDEPTNHLDLEAIQWLEEELLSSNIAVLFITHDRALLKRLATRILELDRGQLTSWPGDYENFLRRKEERLYAESQEQALFDKKLAQEERWIRQGIKARRTRNEGRVRALKALRVERAARRDVEGRVSFNLNEAQKSGQLVLEASHLSHAYQGNPIIKDFSLRIMRGDRIGLIGPNGIGKTTLLKILLGELRPDEGKLVLGTQLDVVYFDQRRAALELEKTVVENVVQGSDFIEIKGQRKHIYSYLSDFLFSPERARTPVKALSGGECNRLLLARLFSQPANVLVLDEPTNDLDLETLELLEELLIGYQGTLLLVSHDRAFLDNVVTSTLVFEGEGNIREYVGGYQDWLQQAQQKPEPAKQPSKIKEEPQPSTPKTSKKLSYKEQKELSDLPGQLERWEEALETLQSEMAAAAFYQKSPADIADSMEKLKRLHSTLEEGYQRWTALEKRAQDYKDN